MEWVEITAKTVDAARDAALDELGVGRDEAEIDVVEEPRPGLFGRTRGQARVRARVKPTQARPKQERRRRGKGDKPKKGDPSKAGSSKGDTSTGSGQRNTTPKQTPTPEPVDESSPAASDSTPVAADTTGAPADNSSGRSSSGSKGRGRRGAPKQQENEMSNDEHAESPVSPQEVGEAAVAFMDGLTVAFGATGQATLDVDDIELDVAVTGEELGLMVGPGGRTLNAIQDLARVAAQRRLGDHETRLRVDVAGYRERRTAALSKFAADVAAQVRESGSARSLEPMTSADRKVIHDALNEEDGVRSTSSGEDPYRRVVVEPA